MGHIPRCDHTSVGMLIWRDGKLLLIERRKPPFGFAPPAGHVDGRQSYEEAARAELKEEVGLDALELKLVAKGKRNNPCRRPGGKWHDWQIYDVRYVGHLTPSVSETKKAAWVGHDDLC